MLVLLNISKELSSRQSVQWGDNQMAFLNSQWRKFHICQLWQPSWELKNWYFTMKLLSQHHLYFNNTCTKFEGQNFHQKKDIQNLPTCVAVNFFSMLPTLIASQGLKKTNFAMKFLEQEVLYVNNIFSKFQCQKINKKKIFTIYQHVSFWENFHYCQLWHPPKGWKIVFLPWIFFQEIISMLKTCDPNFKAKIFIQKKICKFDQHV